MSLRPHILNSTVRGTIVAVGGFLAVSLIVRFMPSPGGKGTPGAIVFLGVVLGLLTALISAGLILIYRTSRVINFAQASIGGVGAVFAYQLTVSQTTHFPFVLSFLIGAVVAGATGAAVELAFVRRFFNASRLVLTVLTIALVTGLSILTFQVPNLPFFGDPTGRTPQELAGTAPIPLPFAGLDFNIGTLRLDFGFRHLFSIGMSIFALLLLGAFLRFTRSGVATRAASENADRAMLLGINVKGLSTVVWAVTGVLSGVGMTLTGTIGSFNSIGFRPEIFLSALAAAVVARMRSLTTAVLTAVALEVLRFAATYNLGERAVLYNVFLFAVILVGLFVQRKEIQRSEEGETSTWEAVQEFRPIPTEMLEISGVRNWRRVMIAAVLLVVVAFPWVASSGATVFMASMAIITISLLSLVVLTGWAGQVSLGQWALVMFGALAGGSLIGKLEWSFWIAVPAASLLTAGFAMLIGLPALRIRGLYLAVTTGAFAFASVVLFDEKLFGWLHPEAVGRPTLFLFDFEDERSMYYLSLSALTLVVVMIVGLRRSRPGRILIALRDNEANAQSFGVNVVRTKLAAFALAGFLCGFAGVLYAVQQRAVSRAAFPAGESLNIFIYTVIGGIGSISGGLLGGLYYAISRQIQNDLFQLVLGPVGLLILLYIAPSGLAGIMYSLRDGVLRIVAQRRRMVVPALFADIDFATFERRLAPLAEPIPGMGLSALPAIQRYKGESELYRNRGRTIVKRRGARDDVAHFGAAAGSIDEREAEIMATAVGDAETGAQPLSRNGPD